MKNGINNNGGNRNLRSPKQSQDFNNQKSEDRHKVNNILDNAGSNILQKVGVPESLADKTIKSNGGKFSPTNSKATKITANKTRDALAKGLSTIGTKNQQNQSKINRPKGNNFGSKILNDMPNMNPHNMTNNGQDSNETANFIKQATSIAKKIPIPQVQAASKIADAANKSGMTDKLTNKLSSKKKNEDQNTESTSTESVFSKLLSDPIVGTMFKIMMPTIISFIGGIMSILFIIESIDFLDLQGVGSSGQAANVDIAQDKKTKEMYQKILDIEQEYKSSGKNVSADKVAATYHIIVRYDPSFKPRDLSDSLIREIFDGSLNGSNYDKNTFEKFLSTNFFPKMLGVNNKKAEKMTNEVFDYLHTYSKALGNNSTEEDCSQAGSCTYDIKGFRINGNVHPYNQQISDLKVRLMQTSWNNMGGIDGQPMPNEELLDFEYYVMGVNYGEIGYSYPEEAQKAFQVIVRSFSLSRPKGMGNSSGTKLAQENGKWILQLRNSVADQVFCHPDKGCSMDTSSGQWSQVYSGVNNPITHFGPIPQNETTIRTANSATRGQVLVDKDGNIVHLGYVDVVQKGLKSKAEEGYDYIQIALEYGASYGATDILTNNCDGKGGSCSSSSLSPEGYAGWKQMGESWSKINLGNSGQNIGQIGCLVTSIAIQIAKSGINTGMRNFNPGTFVEGLNKIGAFSGGGALSSYASPNQVVPGFNYVGYKDLAGLNKSDKLATIKEILNQGYYPVCEVKGNTGQHWVAIDKIEGENIIMMDPGSSAVNLWSEYNWNNTSRIVYYKAM